MHSAEALCILKYRAHFYHHDSAIYQQHDIHRAEEMDNKVPDVRIIKSLLLGRKNLVNLSQNSCEACIWTESP